ncbi:tRNA pseudouridine(38-40) synthase TruA [Hydrogenimonas sp.]
MRVKAVVAYDGSAFYGFQSQTTTPKTVAGALARAAGKLGIHAPIVGSGRTDRGVHATGQVVHFDLPPHWHDDLPKLLTMFNRLLMPRIRIKHIAPVHERFHARFDAKRRIYRYLLKPSPTTPFDAPYCRHLPDLEESRLRAALKLFEGRHDFALFHKKGSDPGSTVRTLYRTGLYPFGRYRVVTFEADGYLRSQVRMMVESALLVMRQEVKEEDIEAQLGGQRRFVPPLAPPQALYLARVLYLDPF